eukprot:RCo010108
MAQEVSVAELRQLVQRRSEQWVELRVRHAALRAEVTDLHQALERQAEQAESLREALTNWHQPEYSLDAAFSAVEEEIDTLEVRLRQEEELRALHLEQHLAEGHRWL